MQGCNIGVLFNPDRTFEIRYEVGKPVFTEQGNKHFYGAPFNTRNFTWYLSIGCS